MEAEEVEKGEGGGGGVGISLDSCIARRRRGATAIKCFRVHNFLNIFITADVSLRVDRARVSSLRN